jgi:xylulokinase
VLNSGHKEEEAEAKNFVGDNEVFFLPYLMGERSPHNDVKARSAFIGMQIDTCRAKMTLSVLEGVAFALRDCFEVAKTNGISILRSKICGGGAKSELWKDIIANVFGIPIDIPLTEEGPSYGAAMLAMCGCGEYKDIKETVASCVKVKDTVEPKIEIVQKYNGKYEIYKELYPSLKGVFKKM